MLVGNNRLGPRCNYRHDHWAKDLMCAAIFFAMTIATAHADEPRASGMRGVAQDFRLYLSAPLRWDGEDWAFLGSSMAAIGIAHRYDKDVRQHFVTSDPSLTVARDSHDLSDAVPAAAALFGTWTVATLTGNSRGKHAAWSMAEAGALSVTAGFITKFATGRERPNDTDEVNSWRSGGDSFPSLHTTAAFAMGAVWAESGNGDYRWVRRALGYGLGVATGYSRVRHNAHWLSDTVAGAALGIASARFVLNRDAPNKNGVNVWITPANGGALLSYSLTLR